MRRYVVVLAALGLLTAGCGARWSDDQLAGVRSRYEGGGGAASATQAAGHATPTTAVVGASPAGGGQSVATGSGGTESGAGGGPVSPQGSGGPAALACAAETTAPGVTGDTITIGAINSLSGPVPGLGATYLAATQAYVARRNAEGGVCGRQVIVLSADDRFDNAVYRSTVIEYDATTLGVITGIAAGGDGGADVAAERGIPMTGTPITTELFESPVVFGMRPAFASYDVATSRFTYHREQGVTKAAIVFLNAAITPLEADRHRRLIEAAGIEVVLYQPIPISTLSYDATARAIANSGADYVFALLEEGGSASLARAIDEIGYPLIAQEYPVAYGSRFIELAGDAAEGASSWIDVLPVEDGGANPEQAALIEWMGTTAPDANIDVFASLGWAATKAFLDSLEALPGPITREALLAQLRGNHRYDAGGMLGPIDLGAQVNGGCFVAMTVEGGVWRRITPAEGFLC